MKIKKLNTLKNIHLLCVHFLVLLRHYLHEECPLGKLLRPSEMTCSSPVQFISLFISPSGKHRQKKSGLGLPARKLKSFGLIWFCLNFFSNIFLPTHSFNVFVMMPLSPSASDSDRFACMKSTLFFVARKLIKNILHGMPNTNGHRISVGT